jgi:CheY-like chemotaxis protein
MKLLVVDDSKEIVKVLSSLLELSGHEVGEAYNGMEAVEWLKHNPCDAVITDAEMPILGGADVCKFIKSEHPDIYIIGISGSFQALKELADAGADVCFSKPFGINELDQAIERRFHASRPNFNSAAGINDRYGSASHLLN